MKQETNTPVEEATKETKESLFNEGEQALLHDMANRVVADDPIKLLSMTTSTLLGRKLLNVCKETPEQNADCQDWALRYSDIHKMFKEAAHEALQMLVSR